MSNVIPDVALIDNSDERAPLVLVLDCSGSMSDENKIGLLNDGLKTLEAELKKDPIAARCGRVLVISFGGDNNVEIMGDWTDAMDFTPPALVAGGLTPLGAAMRCALDEIEAQKGQMRSAGVSYKRPIILLLSDGEPTDAWQQVAADCKNSEAAHKVNIMPIGIGDQANRDILGAFSAKGALNLRGLKFNELFIWLSRSIQAVSRTATGGTVQLNPVDSWAQMQT
jgi:uncharacterized protein YegL